MEQQPQDTNPGSVEPAFVEAVEVHPGRFTLRKLHATDIKYLTRIVSKIGIREFSAVLQSEDVMGVFASFSQKQDAGEEVDVSYVGIVAITEVAGIIVNNYEKCEDDLVSFCAAVSGMSADEVLALDLDEFVELVITIVKKDDFKRAFTVASALFK